MAASDTSSVSSPLTGALKRSLLDVQERFRTVFECSTIGMAVAGPDGSFLQVNSALRELLGYSEPELLTMSFRQITHPDHLEADSEAVRRMLAGESDSYETEKRYIHKDGRVIWGLTSVSAARDLEGRTLYFVGQVQNISERKRAEEELRAAEEKYRSLVEHIPLVTYIDAINPASSNVFTSPQIEPILGYTVEEWREDPDLFVKLLHPDDRERVLAEHARAHGSGEPLRTEYRLLARDGRIVWFRDEAVIVRDDEGRPLYLQGYLLDTTEQRRAQAEVERLSHQNSLLLDAVGEGIIGLDASGVIGFANPAAVEMLGWSQEQLIGRSLHELVHERRFDVDEHADGGAVRAHEARFRRKGGDTLPVEYTRVPIREHAEVVGAVVTLSDITERLLADADLRAAEAKYRTLVERLPLVTYIDRLDEHSSALYMSPQIEPILGYTVDEWTGDNELFPKLLHPDDRERVMAEIAHAHRTNESFRSEYRLLARDGRTVWFRDEAIHELDELGRPAVARGYMLDITARKELEEQLRQSQKMDAVGRLAGGVAHDFNNLLTAIGGYAELVLQRTDSDDPLRRNVEEIKKAGERAASLTGQLLAFSRKQMLQPKVLDLNAIVEDMGKMLEALLGDDIELELELDPALGRTKADPGQVEQIILNLTVNARDAMPDGGRLSIVTAPVELDELAAKRSLAPSPGRYVLLSVADTGSGIEPDVLPKIFEPFFTTKEIGKGTGLGLSTVYGIVEQSGGGISLQSEPGLGTTFRVYLPQLDEEKPVEIVDVVQPLPECEPATIMVVEDEAVVRELVCELLEKSGHTVLAAADAAEALEQWDEHEGRIDLIVTDFSMPGMSGRQLAERLAGSSPRLGVLFMSGYADDFTVEEGQNGARTAFLAKPFSSAALAGKVRDLLESARVTVQT
jgi:two-component system, cell cycle sensor histidine kinase and response regulator CckA